MSIVRFQDIIDQFEHVDDPNVLELAKTNPALRHALEISRPENWHGTGIEPETILAVAKESGIPVAWVPPPKVLKALVTAMPADRPAVLRRYETDILAHCRELLRECDDEWISDEQTLLGRALKAYEAGHHEAAMALAVAVGEPLALWASVPRVTMFDSEAAKEAWEKTRKKEKYRLATMELAAVGPGQKLRRFDVLRHALIAPIPKFFTPFYAKPGEAIPDTLSRHATVHQPTVRHLTVDNALVSIMLGTSILRDEQAWCEEVRMDDALADE